MTIDEAIKYRNYLQALLSSSALCYGRGDVISLQNHVLSLREGIQTLISEFRELEDKLERDKK